MGTKPFQSKSFLENFWGPISFILLLLIASLAVIFYFPSQNPQTNISGTPTNQQVAENSDETNLLNFCIQSIKPEEIHTEIVQRYKQEDESLLLYRNLTAQNAVITFYSQITGSRDIALAILEYSDFYDIPASLAFSLAYNESHYNVKAINKNTNGSIDRGLFQLNNTTFTKLTEKDFFDPYVSAKQGLSFLRFCLDTAGNEITALAMYNAGANRVRNNNTPQQTLNHISRIVNYRKGLEDLFKTEIAVVLEENNKPLLAMTDIEY
jgi:VanZ family protein